MKSHCLVDVKSVIYLFVLPTTKITDILVKYRVFYNYYEKYTILYTDVSARVLRKQIPDY